MQNISPAQLALEVPFEQGQGVTQNYVPAQMSFNLATPIASASEARDQGARKMTSERRNGSRNGKVGDHRRDLSPLAKEGAGRAMTGPNSVSKSWFPTFGPE
jgi:hypothetical protein